MTFEEYMRVLRDNVESFEIYYSNKQEEEPEHYPNELDSEMDWDEEFIAFWEEYCE